MFFGAASRVLVVATVCLLFGRPGLTQTTTQASNDRKIIVDSISISGTESIGSAELSEITGPMSGSKFNDDEDELRERVRAQFQDRGYFMAEVKKLDIKVLDPLASPKTVHVDAEVEEGPLCHLSTMEFTGNHAISTEELRAKFPLKTGRRFRRSEIGGGLVKVNRLYSSLGFLNATAIPDVELDSNATIKLHIAVEEGPQYRMGRFEVHASRPELAAEIESKWRLQAGSVFSPEYLDVYLESVQSLLPASFNRAGDLQLFENCRDETVPVHMHLVHDPQHEVHDQASRVECASAQQ